MSREILMQIAGDVRAIRRAVELEAGRAEFGRILAGLRDRGLITHEDVERIGGRDERSTLNAQRSRGSLPISDNIIKSDLKRYIVKRITDGAYADLRSADRRGVLITWTDKRNEAFETVYRPRAEHIAQVLEINAHPNFGKIIIEEVSHA